MPTEGEVLYYEAIGKSGMKHACHKPFSDSDCAFTLMQVGQVFAALPPPPARILECGCGVGWLSRMFAQRGYECVGIDVAPQAIDIANTLTGDGYENLRFQALDVEHMDFVEEFDGAVFFDSLHHSLDEAAAIRKVFQALKPGGVCITSEPGLGHHANSAEVIKQYDVTEKDMPASHIAKIGRQAGFQAVTKIPRMDDVGRFFMKDRSGRGKLRHWIATHNLFNLLNFVRYTRKIQRVHDSGLVILKK